MNEPKYTAESIGSRLDALLQPVLQKAGFRLKYGIVPGQNPHPDIENPEVVVKFSGPDVELLLENKAELLLALEHIAMEMLRMPPEDHTKLCFDANDYRVLRIEELRVSAITAAERVKRSGVPFRFSPMSSRERRIIHLALRDGKQVRSESAGMGSQRHVVIYPAGMPSAPEPEIVAAPNRFARPRRR